LHRWDAECYEVAAAIAAQWPHLQADAGFYVHPVKGAGDHGWNLAPDGTIVDMTAAQHDYNSHDDERYDENVQPQAPQHPEVISPDHPHYDRYVSWTRHVSRSQEIAHARGEHVRDPRDACPHCPGS
jgi:hypothetical protein